MRTLMATVLSFYARRQLILILSATFDFINGLGSVKGHWKYHRSTERIRFPIDVH